jgi:hypothetical protein
LGIRAQVRLIGKTWIRQQKLNWQLLEIHRVATIPTLNAWISVAVPQKNDRI